MQFKPLEFVKNLGIMGIGMIGIFVVIGAIIVSVAVLNKVTSPKPENKDE
ncbi:MAG: oxaloacetate decarboxylase [Clostridia bacterium]|nr:oxaloacetate decarboxylase [Clostridia bacterium]